jgi:glycosyltransferase involved in cell wall biosynthesis
VHLIGRCGPDVAARMRAVASPAAERLVIRGEGYHVPYSDILEAYGRGRWTAALALFPPTPHYTQKLLTKFFEYMAAGIPIICSDFPAWRTLIRENGCGICVNPSDVEAVRSAIKWLINNPDEVHSMGERGRAAVRERYNWHGEAAKLVELYGSLLQGSEHRIPVRA